MRSICITFLMLILLPVTVLAAPATVQSGEHNAFSRIVVPLEGTDWKVTQASREVVLTFEGFRDGFDTKQVFDLIPRKRIQSLSANKNQLVLTLACDCAVSAVTERDLYVVIDVADTAASLEETAILSPDIREEPLKATTADAAKQNNLASLKRRPPLGLKRDVSRLERHDAANQLHERLTHELSIAARRGVVSRVPDAFSMLPSRPTQIDTKAVSEITPQTQPPATVDDGFKGKTSPVDLANLRIRTSRDLPETFRDLSEIISNDGQVCPPDDTMAVATWGDARTFATQLSEARQGLFGEFDRINPDVAIKLARTYVFFGFGAEARNVLLLNPKIAQEAAYLVAMTRIVDGDVPELQSVLSGLAECQGETALWAMLAAPMPSDGALPNSDNALRALNALPAHLRAILAPKLSDVLLAYGDPSGASKTLRSLDRLAGDLPPAAKLSQAKTNLDDGKNEKGTRQLAEIVGENAAQSPHALIALVNAKLNANQPISPETAKLVEAYAQEFRGTDLEPELRRAHVIALLKSSQFDQAFVATAALGDNDKTSPDNDLQFLVFRALINSANDIVFLDHVFSQPDQSIAMLPADDLIALAKRLLELGFPVRAEQALAKQPDQPEQEKRQLLSARVSLAMGKPLKAQADLLGTKGAESDLIRADAKRMSGAHDEAHVLYESINQTQDATEAAWLSDDWRNLTGQDTPIFGPTSALPLPSEPNLAATGMLARTSALLEQSAHVRKTLHNLLNAEGLQIPVPAE